MPQTVKFTARSLYIFPRSPYPEGDAYLSAQAEMNREDMKSVLRGIQRGVTGLEWKAMLEEVNGEGE